MKTLYAAALVTVFAAVPVMPAGGPLPAWAERLGWTLVHSVWQLAAVAFLAALVDYGARRSSARLRHAIAVLSLGAMLVLPSVTWLWIAVDGPVPQVVQATPIGATGNPPSADIVRAANPVVGRDSFVEADETITDGATFGGETPVDDSLPMVLEQPDDGPQVVRDALSPSVPASAPELPASITSGLTDRLRAAIGSRLAWLVLFWMAGVGFCSLRPICGIWRQWRLRRSGLSPVPEIVSQTLAQVAARMQISRVVRVAQSALVHVPVVVGYLRPMILLPVCAVMGLTPGQLEAVLAHELAHIRRHDWLVNALQVLAETLLFYHPAVWWISRSVRHTRELCCDDLALGVVNDKAVFARALLTLEELRERSSAPDWTAPALAATGGQLARRIRRLLPLDSAPEQASRGWLTGTVLLLVLGIAGGVSLLANPPAVGRPALADDAEPAERDDETLDAGFPPGNTARLDGKTETAGARDKADPPYRVVTVVDEKGRPIAGARVTFQFDIPAKNTVRMMGPVVTDEQGLAQSEIPKSADKVEVYVTAAGFGEGRADELATGKTTIALKQGRVIHVRAVDSRHGVLSDAVPMLAGKITWGREFAAKGKGLFESPSVALTRRRMRVACSQKDGPILFSEPIDVSTAKPGADGVFELTLRPGVRLEGRLDDLVPRPVTEGYAELAIVEGEQGSLSAGERWIWHDFTPVRADGTFIFESLPGGGHAQVHVIVDGFLSKNPAPDELMAYLLEHKLVDEEHIAEAKERLEGRAMWPRFVPLDRPQVAVTIPCVPAAACDFRLLDPSGKPVPGATVSFSPNGVFPFSGHIFVPGYERSEALLVDGLRTGHYLKSIFGNDDPSPHGQEDRRRGEWADRSFLEAKSDAEGRVRVRNLPGGERESFHVTADGFVLPISPLVDAVDLARRNVSDEQSRYGMVELVSGETLEKTIYLERVQPAVDRELIVVDRSGKPLAEVGLAVAEMRVGEKDWQSWSTQRFGAIPRGTTDRFGRLTLRIPSAVDGTRVERIRLGISYSPRRGNHTGAEVDPLERLALHGALVDLPLKADDGVITLLPNPDRPNTASTTYPGIARYGRLEEILPVRSQADWVAALIDKPNLAIVRKLLAGAKVKYPQPVELLPNDRHGRQLFPGEKATGGVRVASDGKDEFVIVEARVRPLRGGAARETELSELPECAYIFDRQGNLLAAVGGELGRTGSNDPDEVHVINLGPREDWFVRVTRFEDNRQFDYVSAWYRVANPVVPSLRLLHWANSGGWSNGPEEIKRYGQLDYDFPDIQGDARRDDGLAKNADGVVVLAGFVWDGDRNVFIGPKAARLRGKSLFEVDTAWSKDFEALSPKADQLVIEGGEYDYGHIWTMAVPVGFEAQVMLSVPQDDGPPRFIERRLGPGRQEIQFYIESADGDAKEKLELRVSDRQQPDGLEDVKFDLPNPVDDKPPIPAPPIIRNLNPRETARLIDLPLTTSKERITLDIKLLAH